MSTALTVKPVAERLNVHERTVYLVAQADKLPDVKVAGVRRFLSEDLDAWIASQKHEAVVQRWVTLEKEAAPR